MILKSRPLPNPAAPPPNRIPAGYAGPITLPTGREVFWTGRVAIGLRHQPQRNSTTSESSDWLQELMLKKATKA